MTDLCRFLAAQGPMLFLGATGLLALGWLGMAVHRAPVHRQRAGELTILGVLVWLALAVVPLPRLSLGELSLDPVAENAGWVEANVEWDEAERSPAMSPRRRWNSVPSYGFADRKSGTADDTAGAPQAVEIDAPWPQSPTDPSIGRLPTVQSQASSGLSSGLTPREPLPQQARAYAPPPSALSFPLSPPSPLRGDAVGSTGADPPIDWGYLLAAVYASGSIGCVTWLALGRMLLWRVSSTAAQPPAWLERLCAEVVPVQRRMPRLLVSGRSGRVFSFGLWRATIVLPAGICLPRSGVAIRHLLAHELAHVRRRDSLGRLVLNLALPLLYFHPLYWRLRGGVALAAEVIADDAAAGQTAKHSYVDALVALARGRHPRRLAVLSSHGLFGSPSQFYRRMKMLLTRKTRLATCCSWRWRVVFGVLCGLAVGLLVATAGMAPAADQTSPVSVQNVPAAGEGAVPVPTAAAQEPPTKAPPALYEPRLQETNIVYDLTWAAPDQFDAVANLLKRVLPGGKVTAFKINRSVVVSGNRAEHIVIRDAIRQIQSLLARPEKADRPPSRPALPPWPVATPGVPAASVIVPAAPPVLRPTAAEPPAATAANAVQPPVAAAAAPPTLPALALPAPSPATTARVTSGAQRFRATFPKGPPQDATPVQMPVATAPSLDANLAAGRPAAEGSQLDLVSLANSYTDALANLKIASLQNAHLRELQKSAAVSNEEVEIAAIKLDAAQRKLDLLRSIVESALRTSEMELQVLHQLHKAGTQPSGVGPLQLQIPRVEGRLEILKRILETSGPGMRSTKY